MTNSTTWLLLTYRVPREPSAARVYVWRKLKKLGAIAVQDAIWLLPSTARTLEQFRWLTDEIEQMGGQANLWEARALSATTECEWADQFEERVAQSYRRILKALSRSTADVTALSRQYQQALAKDYFQSAIGKQVRAKLLSAGAADGKLVKK